MSDQQAVGNPTSWPRRYALTFVSVIALCLFVVLWQRGAPLRNYLAPQGLHSLASAQDAASARKIVAAWRDARDDAEQQSMLSDEDKRCCDALARAKGLIALDSWFIPFYVAAIGFGCWRFARRLSGRVNAYAEELWRREGVAQNSGIAAAVTRFWRRAKLNVWRLLVPFGYLLALAAPVAGMLDIYENVLLKQTLALYGQAEHALTAQALAVAPSTAVLAQLACWKWALALAGLLFIAVAAAAVTQDWRWRWSLAWHFGKRCVFVLLFLAAAIVLFLLLDQGQDYLRRASQPGAKRMTQVLFVLFAVLWSLASWYAARLAARQPGDWRAPETASGKVRKWLPRVLGVAPHVVIALAFCKLGEWWWAAGFASAAVAMALFVIYRRTWFQLPNAEEADEDPIFGALLAGLALASVVFAVICWSPVDASQTIGAPGLVFLAAAVWIVAGTIVFVLIPLRNKKPTLAAVPLLLFAAFSPFNDNHRIRQLAPWQAAAPSADAQDCAKAYAGDGRCDLPVSAYFDAWFKAHHGNAAAKVPVYIAVAEGGGVRAAYWTAAVLGRLEDASERRFHKHLFAVSGISGGSLGAVVYGALLSHARENALQCEPGNGHPPSFERCSAAVLAQDFVAPALGGLLVTDTFQRFWPRPVERWDRARSLEEAWEQGWRQVVNAEPGQGLDTAFVGLWRNAKCPQGWCYDVPLLLLNGAVVQTGQRSVISPLVLAREGATAELHDVVDPYAASAGAMNLALSTAAHMSARFPVISPAGWFETQPAQGRRYLHVVDGGAFEPLGSSTAQDLLDAIENSIAYMEAKVELRVLVITNSPAGDRRGSASSSRLLSEVVDQPLTLLRARTAHGDYFDAKMRTRFKQHYIRLGMYPNDLAAMPKVCTQCPPPLGWTLSNCTQDDMDRTLRSRLKSDIDAVVGTLNERR